MKKLIICTAIIMALAFGGCSGKVPEAADVSFKALILEINGDSVLVEPLEGEDERRSSDKISFSKSGLDDLGEPGDTVSITYGGEIMESYPAQLVATGWSLVSKGEPAGDNNPGETVEKIAVAHDFGDVSMSLALPSGWGHEIRENGWEDGADLGISFWPESGPELVLNLEYRHDRVGICGTGVTFTDMEFSGGMTATACTEDMQGTQWFLLIYDEPYVNYTVSCTADTALWKEHETEIMAILDTIQFK